MHAHTVTDGISGRGAQARVWPFCVGVALLAHVVVLQSMALPPGHLAWRQGGCFVLTAAAAVLFMHAFRQGGLVARAFALLLFTPVVWLLAGFIMPDMGWRL